MGSQLQIRVAKLRSGTPALDRLRGTAKPRTYEDAQLEVTSASNVSHEITAYLAEKGIELIRLRQLGRRRAEQTLRMQPLTWLKP